MASKENREQPCWKGSTMSHKISVSIWQTIRKITFKKKKFLPRKSAYCHAVITVAVFYFFFNVLSNQVCVDNRLSLSISPTKEIVYISEMHSQVTIIVVDWTKNKEVEQHSYLRERQVSLPPGYCNQDLCCVPQPGLGQSLPPPVLHRG